MPDRAERRAMQPLSDDRFPETQTEILRAAARGDWDDFFRQYLRPCWREVMFACRARNLPIGDDEDVFQELVVRIVKEGRYRGLLTGATTVDQSLGEPRQAPANLVNRYLFHRDLPIASARFRTYLKGVIRNVVLELLRARRRQPIVVTDQAILENEPGIEASVADSLERHWIRECLSEAAWRLKQECDGARTKGKKRLFGVLYRSAVDGERQSDIAEHYALDRTTVAELLARARLRFVELLKDVSGIDDLGELKAAVTTAPGALRDALDAAARCSRDDAPKI